MAQEPEKAPIMKWSSWILYAGALALVFGVIAMVTRQATSTPEEVFSAVQQRIARGVHDKEQILLNLDHCLQLATQSDKKDLEAEIRRERGAILVELGAFDRARADLTAVVQHAPQDRKAIRALIELELRAREWAVARARLEDQLRNQPDDAAAWSVYARSWRLETEDRLAKCKQLVEGSLAAEQASEMMAQLRHSAALPLEDLRRSKIAHRLEQALQSDQDYDSAVMLGELDEAARCNAQARAAAEKACALAGDADALVLLLTIRSEAMDTDAVARLAMAAERSPVVRRDVRVPSIALPHLRMHGRAQLAADLAQSWSTARTQWPASFWHEACVSLWEAKRWEGLHAMAIGLRSDASVSAIAEADFWLGVSLSRAGFAADAQRFLTTFLLNAPPEPIPHARAIAYLEAARGAKAAGAAAEERRNLLGFVQEWPEGDGEAWMRLAELAAESDHGGWRAPVEQQAKAIELLPARVDELLPRWMEWGERHLQLIGFDRNNLGADRGPEGATTYELYRTAQAWLELGEHTRALGANRRLLAQLPGFLPALDLAIEIAVAQGRDRDIVEAVASRVQRGGRTPRLDTVLAAVDPSALTPKSRLALIEADPERMGRLLVAQDLLTRGETQLALGSLEAIAADAWTEDARVLAAQLRLERGDYAQAADLILPARTALAQARGALEIAVEALAAAGRSQELRTLLGEYVQSIPPKRLLVVCDVLLRHNQAAAALQVARQLDADPKTRGAETLVRLLSAQLILGQYDLAEGTIERLDAFDSGARSARLKILLGVVANQEDLITEGVSTLRPLAAASPVVAAQLALVSGEANQAAAALEKLPPSESVEKDTIRYLTRALTAVSTRREIAVSLWMGSTSASAARVWCTGPDGKRSARLAAAWLIAMREPAAAAVVQANLTATAAALPEGVWDHWMLATLQRSSGDRVGARHTSEALVAAAPDFGPGWEVLGQLGWRQETSERERAARELKRMEGLGALAAELWERKLLEGVYQYLDGSPAKALELAGEAAALQPRSLRVARLGALAAAKLGEDAQLLSWTRQALSPRTDTVDELTPREAAELVHIAAEASLLIVRSGERTAQTRALWDDLAAARTKDPLATLAAARLYLTLDARNPAVGVTRAMSRLARFREQHAKACLDDLAPGATHEWTLFHSSLDPQAAEEFLAAERRLQPALASLWMDSPDVAAAAGRLVTAAQAADLAHQLLPRAGFARTAFQIASQGELTPEAIELALTKVPAAENLPGADPELVLHAARAYANLGARHAVRARDLHTLVKPHLSSQPQLKVGWYLLGLQIAVLMGGDEARLVCGGLLKEWMELKPMEGDVAEEEAMVGVGCRGEAPL